MAILILAVGNSCSLAGGAEIRRTAGRFMESLYAGDRAQLALLAPGMAGDGRLEQLFAAIVDWPRWSIARVSRRGDSARVVVALAAEGRGADLVLPLSRVQGSWVVDSIIVEERRLDFVPADR